MSAQVIKLKEYSPGIQQATIKLEWQVSSDAPKTVDDLYFTKREPNGCINWWAVTKPSNYYSANYMVGRAHAFDVIELMFNPKAKNLNDGLLSNIAINMAENHKTDDGVMRGFFSAFSELLLNGKVVR
ncbi:MAG: hypothetical protein OEY66_07185 [Gammaproteobacteria bacterium]|nr:hypothetical protein [Gammaproteobacteria bacterium]